MALYMNMRIFFIILSVGIIHAGHEQVINNYLAQYKRPFTLLEISNDTLSYGLPIAQKYNATVVSLLLGKLPRGFNINLEREYPQLIILNPTKCTLEDLNTLVRCEHFDVVIIRDLDVNIRKNYEFKHNKQRVLELLLKLGDALFIELPINHELGAYIGYYNGQIISKKTTDLYFTYNQKRGLDIARWSRKHLPELNQPRYPIISNFEQKLYIKDNAHIMWLKGINLVTFVMLRGICPCDQTIAQNIRAFRNIQHNDLIIGNMIIQGTKLVAIDINDPRWDSQVEYCITAALRVFSGDTWRLRDPEKCMQAYREFLSQEP
jgi:hypothetical protein